MLKYFTSIGGALVSHYIHLFVTLRTVACQVPLSMGFSRQEYWSGLPFPSQGKLSNPVTECRSPVLQVDSLSLSHQETLFNHYLHCNCPMSRAIQTVKTILKEWRNIFSLLMGEATNFP